jgi:hypothetical protein
MRCVSTWYGVSLLKYETDHFFYRTACAWTPTTKTTARKPKEFI